MALSQIVTDDDLIEVFGEMPTEGENIRLRALRTMVENDARRFVGHNITQPSSDYVEFHPIRVNTRNVAAAEYYDIVGTKVVSSLATSRKTRIRLRQKYARSITYVWEDLNANFGNGATDFASATLLTSGTDYGLQWDASETGISLSSLLIRIDRYWPSTPGTVKVQYNAGLTAAELADEYLWIKHALIEEIGIRFNRTNVNVLTDAVHPTGSPIKEQSIPGDFKQTYDTTTENLAVLSALSPGVMRKLTPAKHNCVGV